ncbi:hypothetical protein QJR26_04445 [Clostridium baratii]
MEMFEYINRFILFSIAVITIICLLGIEMYLIGLLMCDICRKIVKSRLCIKFIKRAITKRSLKRIKRSNLVLFLLGDYLIDYEFYTGDELEREVKKYKYLIGDGISKTIFMLITSRIFFFWSSKEERKILKEVLKKNKEKLDRVNFKRIKEFLERLDYKDKYWEFRKGYITKKEDYKYNDENYYKYFSKSPIEPKEALLGDFDMLKCRELNEIIEVVDNPEKEFPLYIDPFCVIEQHYKK